MKHVLVFLFTVFTLGTYGQGINAFDGRWCFAGSNATVFVVKENKLFVTLVNDDDTKLFSRFYAGKELGDSILLFPVSVDSAGKKVFLSARITQYKRERSMLFVFDRSVDSIVNFVGDVYYDSAKVRFANRNCNLDVPACINYLYHRSDLIKITKLKAMKEMTRSQVFDVFKQFEAVSRSRCNKCYEGFPGADFNRIVINMGFNPIYQKEFNRQLVYQTSSFDFLHGYFIGASDAPRDKELNDFYQKIRREYWGK